MSATGQNSPLGVRQLSGRRRHGLGDAQSVIGNTTGPCPDKPGSKPRTAHRRRRRPIPLPAPSPFAEPRTPASDEICRPSGGARPRNWESGRLYPGCYQPNCGTCYQSDHDRSVSQTRQNKPAHEYQRRDVQIIAAIGEIGEAIYGQWWRRHVARALGVHACTVSRWLQGKGRPTYDDLHRLMSVARTRYHAILAAHEAGREILRLLPPPPEKTPANKPARPVLEDLKLAAPAQASHSALQPIKPPTIHGPILPGRPPGAMRRPQ